MKSNKTLPSSNPKKCIFFSKNRMNLNVEWSADRQKLECPKFGPISIVFANVLNPLLIEHNEKIHYRLVC